MQYATVTYEALHHAYLNVCTLFPLENFFAQGLFVPLCMWIYIVICYDALNEGEICNVGCICIHCTDVTKKEEIGSIQETLQTGCVSEVEI